MRVVLQASEKVPFRVQQEQGRVTVAIARDLARRGASSRSASPAASWTTCSSWAARDNLFAITLGRRFQQLQAFEQEDPPRLVLEFQAAPLRRGAGPAPSPAAAWPAPRTGARGSAPSSSIPATAAPTVGAQGPGGTLEKDVTLAIARKLRAAVAERRSACRPS